MKRNLSKLLVAVLSLVLALGISVSAYAAEGDKPEDGKYALKSISSSLGMVGNHLLAPTTVTVKGDDALLVLTGDESVAKRFDEIYIGKYEDITEENADTIGIKGNESAGGTVSFSIPLKTSDLSATEPLYYVMRYKKGYSETHNGDWYKASTDHFFTLGEFTPVTVTELAIENKTNMFKAVSAALESLDGNEYLVASLSGAGYREMFKGIYEEAVANGTKTENWIHSYTNADGKLEFMIPVEDGESFIPVVAVSNSYYEKYLNGENDLARAFYPRQMTIDREAKTLVTDDYDQTIELTVNNDISMFKPGSKADLHIVGGPNSNTHKNLLTLYTDSTSVTKIRSGEAEIEKEAEVNEFGGYTFKDIPVETGKAIVIGSWSEKNSKYYDRTLYIDVAGKTAYFANAASEVVDFYGLTEEEAKALAKISATPELCGKLIDAIYVQKRDSDTDALCAAAKACWDALSEEQQEAVEGEDADPDYFGRDTGDASEDDPLNQDEIGDKEILVVSFGTSFNESRVKDICAVEKAIAEANPGWSVRRAFTAQIIINHIQAREGYKIDNMSQALQRAIDNGVKHLIVQPTHLMHGAEYDELVADLAKVSSKFESVDVAEPLLGEVGKDENEINDDKMITALAAVNETVEESEYETLDAMDAAKTAIVFMGHGTSHDANITYSQMQAQMNDLGYKNVFIGTVEGKPASTALPEVKKAVEKAGYNKVILRPLMVVAGDHANNDMAGDEEGSWYYGFVNGGEFEVEGADAPVNIGEGFGAENVTCQIAGLGRIPEIQALYVAHTDIVRAAQVDQLIEQIYVQTRTSETDEQCAAAKAAWDALTEDQKLFVEEYDYFGRDTGDASADDPLNQDEIGENEILVVSFGTSFNDSRAKDIGGIEKAVAEANPGWSVRRAFTAQIILNHVQARDNVKMDNMSQALQRAIKSGVKNLVVQPTHLMHGAEYDELVEDLKKVESKFESVKIAEPLLGEVGADETAVNEDKEAVAKAAVAEAVKVAGFDSVDKMAEAGTALVFMGHGTSHKAAITYSQMQAQMNALGYQNVFIGTVEGNPASTALPEVKKAVEAAGYKKAILRPLMVVAGDHANNDMADDEPGSGSWFDGFANGGEFEVEGADKPVDIGAGFGAENVTCQIEGLGRIADIQKIYVAHTKAVIEDTPEPVVKKKANPMTVKAKKITAKAKKTTTFKKAKAFTVKKAQGKVTFKKIKGDKKVTISKTGKVTVKKGLKKKTYSIKVKVTAAGNANYKSKSKTVTLKVKVK